jgi:cell division transport system ATP-binding protein
MQKGEFVILTGPSGAGKTTLMKLLSFEQIPTHGDVLLEGFSAKTIRKREVPKLRRRIGLVFQDFRLLSERTAYENVAIVLRATGAPQAGIHRRVLRALTSVGLSSKTKSMPHELSGGEQQRVAIARAIVNDPFVVLADEPTGNLDAANAREVFRMLKKISAAGTAVLVATHDVGIAGEFRARTLMLERGQLVQEIAATVPTSTAVAAMQAAIRPNRPAEGARL